MKKRFLAAIAGFIGGGVLSLLLLGLVVSVFDMGFRTVMPAARLMAFICGLIGFCLVGVGAGIFWFVDG
jgi:hypothetical protein